MFKNSVPFFNFGLQMYKHFPFTQPSRKKFSDFLFTLKNREGKDMMSF